MSSLEQFIVFKEVAETGNITQAARHLHISQPSVSIQLQNLEKEYGACFFERTNRGVTLTEFGRVFYKSIVHVIQTMNETKETILSLTENQSSCIHVGATLTIGEYLLSHIMSINTPQGKPPLRFNVLVANTLMISRSILDKKFNIGLVEGPVPYDENLVIEQFWSDELVIAVPIDHPWSKRIEVSFEELKSENLILREVGSGTRKVMEMAMAKNGLDADELTVVAELSSIQAIKDTVMAGLGVTVISALAVQEECRHKRLSMLKLRDCPLERPLNILTNCKSILTSDEEWFLSRLRSKDTLRALIPAPFLP
ncbi:LysR family transcriptional regulator [Adlercreutzia sp. ZJ473]|uniref:LysR family transcriptional regulator n=1 Tax=Adlercreutzia sp. ZJ473 TaxID=2722822 RepID=UPI001556E8E5